MAVAQVGTSNKDSVSIREFIERVVDERDRLYGARFEASAVAVNAALAAQEKAVAAAFGASEKAIIKAEDAQREYNIRSNEFRGQLDDQAKMLMPRSETAALFKAYDERVDAVRAVFESKLDNQRQSFDKALDAIFKEIAGLRESRSQFEGSKSNNREMFSYVVAIIGIVIAVAAFYVKQP